ncbi:MAG: Rpn family recombination-promoting nuclease/putative transposase [Clostridium butyricum]|nr:Rpn family recombination-promoting nuclease/putative transposase [Clostridium butyricum]
MNNKNLVNILVDFAFKKVFAGEGEKSKYLLKDFLNSILELTGTDRIKTIEYLNPFNDREHEKDKQSIMDIKVKTEADELIDIEVQISDVDDYKKRSLYYWSRLYGETIEKGKGYIELKKSIVINILDFKLIDENNKYHNVFMIKEKEDNFKFIDDLEIHYIELAKFNKQDINNLNDLEEWLLFLRECNKNGDEKILEKLKIEKEEIKMAVEIMNKLSADEKEYQQYLAREKFLMDEISKKRYAEIKRQELENKLRKAETKIKESETKIKQAEARSKEAEARSKEAEAKIKEAEAKSKEAEDKIIITIENLLKSGISDEIISASTGLSIDQINEIKRRT